MIRLRLRRALAGRIAAVSAVVSVAVAITVVGAGPAEALPAPAGTSCSTTTSPSSCDIGTSTTVSAGSLGIVAPSTLYWSFTQNGYNQVASASAAALSGCTATSGGTTCTTGGTAPVLRVIDATGSGNGWAVSAYVSSSNLPTNTALSFNGAGTTIGSSSSTATPATTTPATVCDSGSSCTNAVAQTSSCATHSLGVSGCASYPQSLLSTSSTAQVDLFSSAASKGLGAVCFASGSATGSGCAGTTPTAFFNMTVPASATAGTYSGAVITLTASSAP